MRLQYDIDQGRSLRNYATTAERKLWARLRLRQLNGRRFRRQYPVGPFVADFCCPEISLIVEVDGDSHALREEYDAGRQAYLEAHGFRVVRFTNPEVFENLEAVMQMLWELTGDPPLRSGGG